MDLSAAMGDAESADTAEAKAAALRRIAELLDRERDATGNLTADQAAMLAEVIQTEDAIRRSTAATDGLVGATGNAAAAARDLASAWAGVSDSIVSANAAALRARAELATVGKPVERAGELAGLKFDEENADLRGGESILRAAYDQKRAEAVRLAQEEAALREQVRLFEHPPAPARVGGGGGAGIGLGGYGAGASSDDRAERVLDALRTEVELMGKSEAAARIANGTRRAGLGLYSEQGQAIADLVEEIDRLNEAQKRTEESNQLLADSFTSLVDGATHGLKGLRSAVADLAGQLAQTGLSNLVTDLVGDSGLGGSGFGEWLANAFGHRAAGGPVDAGMPYLVGERGPELLVPRSAGTVIPNHALGGGQDVRVHVSVGVDRSGELKAVISDIARAHVAGGRRAYDARLADRMHSISADPRFRG